MNITLPAGVALMTPRRTLPRTGLADPAFVYRRAIDTDVAATFAAERKRLAQQPDVLQERAAVRAVIAELCDAPAADLPLPLPPTRPAAWDFTRHLRPGAFASQRGYLDTDTAVALAAVALFAAACRFGGLFG